MDPSTATDIAAQPGTIETAYAVLAAAAALITGIGGTIAAVLKAGIKTGDPPKEISTLPVPDGWREMRTEIKSMISGQQGIVDELKDHIRADREALRLVNAWDDQMKLLFRRVEVLTRNHHEHERLVAELHSGLLDTELVVQRRLQAEKIDEMLLTVRQLKVDQVSISRGVQTTAEATSTVARKLKELSQ